MAQRILAMVLAGGEGSRLHPLTLHRSKPAVPFAGRYRIVDFVLSNLVNSEIYSIYLMVQYKSQSLIEHIRKAWVLSPVFPNQFVTVVPPQMREGPEWFQGTADAIYQNLNLIKHHKPDLVAVFGADHIYRMDVRQMVRAHCDRGADVTVAALPVPIAAATAFGVIETNGDGRIVAFHEKPRSPIAMPGDPLRAYASMGNYLFSADVLSTALRDARERGDNDFGRHLLPRLARTHRVCAYDFSTNRVAGTAPSEEPGYWRDVGTVDQYFAAHQDLLGAAPRFSLYNPQWQVSSSSYPGPTPHIVRAEIDNSILGSGTFVRNARIRNCVIRREVVLEDDVELDDCIIMDSTRIGRGARLRRVIVDRNNVIAPGARIGYGAEVDRARHFVTDSGITVLPQGDGCLVGADGEAVRYA